MLCTNPGFFAIENTTTIVLATQTNGATTGAQSSVLWHTELGLIGQITTEVIVADLDNDGDNDSVIFGTSYDVICLDILTGDLLCNYRSKSAVTTVAAIGDVDADGLNDINDNNTELLALWPFGDSGRAVGYGPEAPSGTVRAMRAIDRQTGETLWEFAAPLANLTSEGLHEVRIVGDLNGDGKDDILGFSQVYEYEGRYNGSKYSMLRLIDGTTGELLWSMPVQDRTFINSNLTPAEGLYADDNIIDRRINTVDIINDITGDGINDIVVGGEAGQLYLLNGATGTNIGTLGGEHPAGTRRVTGHIPSR